MTKGKTWSKREVAILRRYYPGYGTIVLTKVLKGRTQNQIKHKAHALGIKADSLEERYNLKRITL